MPWTLRESLPLRRRLVELRTDVPIRCLAHAAPESIAENGPLVGDGLALKDTFHERK